MKRSGGRSALASAFGIAITDGCPAQPLFTERVACSALQHEASLKASLVRMSPLCANSLVFMQLKDVTRASRGSVADTAAQ
jgi:hypothetical protein